MALTYTIKDSREVDDTLMVDTIFSDGKNEERTEVAVFQPADDEAVFTALENRAKTYEVKWEAEAAIPAIKTDVDKEKDKPIPVTDVSP